MPRPVVLALVLVFAACDDPPVPSFPEVAPPPSPSAEPTPEPVALPRDAVSGRLAFSAETGADTQDVFVLDLGDVDARRHRVTDGTARAFDPDLSPDGSRIVYRVNPEAGNDAADLWLTDVEGPAPVNLTGDPTLDNWSPAWSPDGSRIAFASTREGGTLSVWTMAPDGSDLRRVTAGHGEYPDWSPDGSRIVYAAPRTGSSGRYELWLIDAAGRRPAKQLTNTPTTEFAPAWSPDGGWIAYQLDAGNRWELWVVRIDGSEARRISPEAEDGVWPVWSPDGLLGWSGTQGLSFADVAGGGRLSFMPDDPGTDFLSWGR